MDARLDWDFIKAQLPEGWRELAAERGLIRPQPPQLHAKVTDIEQVLRPLLFRIGVEASLQTAVSTTAMARKATAAEAGDDAAEAAQLLDLSAPALHYWERKLPGYLSELLARMIGSADMFSPARWHGYDVVVTDGTTVTRPGATGTTARALYALRLADLSPLGCHQTDEHGTESMRIFDVRPGQLWEGDRFYANPYDIAWVVDAGGDVLVRYKFNALPLYEAQGSLFDVMAHVRQLREPGEIAEWPAQVRPTDHEPIQGRLCAVRLPEERADKERDRLRRDDPKVSARSLEVASWLIVFTTAPVERLPLEDVPVLYRLRWQVELEIRRDKSLGGLDKLPNFRPDTIATWLLGKLLLQQIARKIVSPSVAFPPSAACVDVFFSASQRDPREAAPPRRKDRRRPVARDGAHLRGHPRRSTSRAAA